MSDAPADSWPPPLQAALEAPAVPAKSWQDGVGPAFIALFLSVVFLDRLAPGTLLVGGLAPSAVGAVFASVLGYWGLYYAPALWGATRRRPMAVVASSTFGARGASWVPGLLTGLVAIVWFAVTIDAATEWSLSALVSSGLLDAKHLGDASRGGWGGPRPLFLFVAGAWSITSAVLGVLAVRLVAAILLVYPIFPALVLGLLLLWALPGVASGPVSAKAPGAGGLEAAISSAQWVFAFLAANALTVADWGAASKTPRDARLGGVVGVMLAAPILAVVSLLIVAGARGRGAEPRDDLPPPRASVGLRPARGLAPSSPATIAPATAPVASGPSSTIREVLLRQIGGWKGGVGLFTLALALLGPACFTPFLIARQFTTLWPGVPRLMASMAGALATWPLIASGAARRHDLMFGLMGASAAPVAGAMAAEYFLRRGDWPGPRRGANPAGLIAWALGAGVGLLPLLGLPQVQPSAILAFATAFVAYLALARLGLESAPIPMTIPIPDAPSPAAVPSEVPAP